MEYRTASPRSTPPTAPPAGAAPAESGPAGNPATTTSAPQRPTDDDVALLAFAQAFELTARDVYQAALDGGLADSDLADVFRTMRENHEEYANLLSGILGVDAPQRRDDALFEQFVGDFEGGDPTAVAEAGMSLEAAAVATHTELLAQLDGTDAVASLGGIVVIEARHYTVLASVAGRGDDLDAMLTAEAAALPLPEAASGWRQS